MTVVLESYELPQRGTFTIQQTIDIQVSADEARLQVKDWLLDGVSYMMGVESPTLIVNSHTYWRVPVIYTAPPQGKVGNVGHIDLDATTGKMDTCPEKARAMHVEAKKLSVKLPPFKLIPIENAPSEYLPDDIGDVPILQWPDDDDEPISLENVTYYTRS